MRDFKLSGPAWFDASPEPVILAHDGDTAYYNAAAAALAERSGWTLKEDAPLPEPLRAIDGVGVQTLELAGEHWVCRTERLKAGLLICLTLSPSSITVPLERLAQLAEQMRLPLGSLIGVSQLLAQSDGERTEEKTSQYQSIQRKSYYTLLRMWIRWRHWAACRTDAVLFRENRWIWADCAPRWCAGCRASVTRSAVQ